MSIIGEHIPRNLAPVDHIEEALATYGTLGVPPYRWATEPEPVPLSVPEKPMSACRIAVLASGGFYRTGQVAFHFRDDTSYRRVPVGTPADALRIAHFGYDIRDALRDPNILLPLAPLHELARAGVIGGLSPFALTFMGGIYSQRRVRDELVPALRTALDAMQPDVVLLVPACPVCHQTAGLLARAIERSGLPTVCLTSAHSITARVNPPRAAFVDFPLGHTAGRPHRLQEQTDIVASALSLVERTGWSGGILPLDASWGADWKAAPTSPDYDWPPRHENPFYLNDADRDAAIARHGFETACIASPERRPPPD